jgi:hypothetical protein
MGVAGENAGTGAKLPQFDNTPGTRKHSATELFNERHGLSAFFCSGFLAGCRHIGINRYRDECTGDEVFTENQRNLFPGCARRRYLLSAACQFTTTVRGVPNC